MPRSRWTSGFLSFGIVVSTLVAWSPSTTAATNGPPVVVILMENTGYDTLFPGGGTDPNAPYLTTTLRQQGRLFTNDFALAHPSLPNYLQLTSGTANGCTDDKCQTNDTTTTVDPRGNKQENIFHQLSASGTTFASYEESMPSPCYRSDASPYVVHHNPEAYFNKVASVCSTTDLPYSSLNVSNLPAFSFVTPNNCNNMHDACASSATRCDNTTGRERAICNGDVWLNNHVETLLANGAIVIVTFDESESSGGNHIVTIMAGPGVPANSTDATRYDHHSLLAGLENYFGLDQINGALTLNKSPISIPDGDSVQLVQRALAKGSGTNASVSLQNSVTTNDLLVAVVGVAGTPTVTVPPSWTFAAGPSSQSMGIYYKVASGGATAVSFGVAPSNNWAMEVLEFSGISTTNPLDQDAMASSGATGTSTTMDSGTTPTTTQAHELVVAGLFNNGALTGAAANHNFRRWDSGTSGNNNWTGAYGKVISSTATPSLQVTIANAKKTRGAIATFRAAAQLSVLGTLSADETDGSVR